MSPSELLRETGLRVSPGQFRRYMASGIIPGVRRGKRGRFAVVGPVQLKRSALTNVRFSRLNLAGTLIEFGWWMDQSEPVDTRSDAKKYDVLRELIPAAVVARRLADDLKQEIPDWDGTKTQLRQLRS